MKEGSIEYLKDSFDHVYDDVTFDSKLKCYNNHNEDEFQYSLDRLIYFTRKINRYDIIKIAGNKVIGLSSS